MSKLKSSLGPKASPSPSTFILSVPAELGLTYKYGKGTRKPRLKVRYLLVVLKAQGKERGKRMGRHTRGPLALEVLDLGPQGLKTPFPLPIFKTL